jgi:hypothetical protein
VSGAFTTNAIRRPSRDQVIAWIALSVIACSSENAGGPEGFAAAAGFAAGAACAADARHHAANSTARAKHGSDGQRACMGAPGLRGTS